MATKKSKTTAKAAAPAKKTRVAKSRGVDPKLGRKQIFVVDEQWLKDNDYPDGIAVGDELEIPAQKGRYLVTVSYNDRVDQFRADDVAPALVAYGKGAGPTIFKTKVVISLEEVKGGRRSSATLLAFAARRALGNDTAAVALAKRLMVTLNAGR